MATIGLTPDFRDFLKLLIEHEVRYLLIGGYAVAAYGFKRNTKDIDFWVAVDDENARRLSAVLLAFDLPPETVQPDRLMAKDRILRIGHPPNRIEILTDISGVEFEECWTRRLTTAAHGISISLIARDDLIANKRASGRPQDLADVARLLPQGK